MEKRTKLKTEKTIKDETTTEIKKRGLVGAWKGKIKIVGDIDNVFNFNFNI